MDDAALFALLSPAELDVVRLRCAGRSGDEIAAIRHSTHHTIRMIASVAYRKLGVAPSHQHKSAEVCYRLGFLDRGRT